MRNAAGDYDEAMALIDAGAAQRLALRPDDIDLRDMLTLERASIVGERGDFAGAVALAQGALASRRERLGAEAPLTLVGRTVDGVCTCATLENWTRRSR